MHKRGYVLLCLDNETSVDNVLSLVKKVDSRIQKIHPQLSATMMNYLPPGTLIVKDSSGEKDTGYITLPMFSSHFSLPIKEGEYVWFFEDNLAISEKSLKVVSEVFPLLEIKNYWISRIHGYSTCSEDVNYHNLERDALAESDFLSFIEEIDQNASSDTKDQKRSKALKDESKDKMYLPDHEKNTSFQSIFNIDTNPKKLYDYYKSKDKVSIDAIPTQYSLKHEFTLQGSNNTLISLTKDMSQNKGEINLVCGKSSLKDYVENHDDVLNDINKKIEREYIKLPSKTIINTSTGMKEIKEGTLLHATFPEFENAYGQKEMLKDAKKYFKNDLEKEVKSRPENLDLKSHQYDSSYFLMYMNTNLSTESFSDFTGEITRLNKESKENNINTFSLGQTKPFDVHVSNTPELNVEKIDLDKVKKAIPSVLIKSNDIQLVARKELKHLEKDILIPDGSISLIKDGYYRGKNKNSYSHIILERNGDILLDGKTINIGEYDREKLRLDIEEDDLMHGLGEGVILGYDQNLSEPLVLGSTLNAILNELLLINIEALDHISKAFAEISSNFVQLEQDHIALKTWAASHGHQIPVLPYTPLPGPPPAPVPTMPGSAVPTLEVKVKYPQVDTDASSTINGGDEIKRLNDIKNNLIKMLSRFSKTT